MTAVSWGSSKWAHWNDGRHVVLRASAGRTGDERQASMDDDELVAALLADLGTTMGITAEPVARRVARWPLGFTQYTVGHLDRVERIEASLGRDCPGVVLAGSPYRGLGLPACIRQGRDAALRLLG
jgi:oxygen-dependent protoporphyrinogen oxidase